MRPLRLALPGLALGLALGVQGLAAAPAPWYRWRSLSGGAEACAQASPGAGWQQVGGPFVDARCLRPLRVVPLGFSAGFDGRAVARAAGAGRA